MASWLVCFALCMGRARIFAACSLQTYGELFAVWLQYANWLAGYLPYELAHYGKRPPLQSIKQYSTINSDATPPPPPPQQVRDYLRADVEHLVARVGVVKGEQATLCYVTRLLEAMKKLRNN